MSITFVSAFLDLGRIEPRPRAKSRGQYLREGRKLIEAGVPLVLFVERASLGAVFAGQPPPAHVEVVPFEFRELWLQRWLDEHRGLRLPAIRSVEKDTLAYMSVQHQKTDWVRRAAALNPFRSDSFAWVDFGFTWMIESPVPEVQRKLQALATVTVPPGLVVAPGREHPASLLRDVHPFYLAEYPYFSFLGTFFAAGAAAIERFDSTHKQVAGRLFVDSGVVTWEVVVWMAVWARAPELFAHYRADHDDSFLDAFPRDTTNCLEAR